ncbi:MAG: hypothetical protein R2822_10070 [Spirosomataceae bacterium]
MNYFTTSFSYAPFFWFISLLVFNVESYAQRLQSDNGQKIRIYTFDVKRIDGAEIYRNVLYDISDSALIVVDKESLISIVNKWKAEHDGSFPSADSLTALITPYAINFQNLKWVKINKVSGATIGFLAGIAIAAITILPGDSGYEGIVFLGLGVPFSLLGGLIGGIATPQRKFHNRPKYRFQERITQKWRKYTITEQLRKVYK